LAHGAHCLDQLPSALATAGYPAAKLEDILRMVHQLDDWGVLERADSDDQLDARTQERHASNLRYYDLFSDLSHTSADMHLAAARSTVLLLAPADWDPAFSSPWSAWAWDRSPSSTVTLSRLRTSRGSSFTTKAM
jgi:hypothetical protein